MLEPKECVWVDLPELIKKNSCPEGLKWFVEKYPGSYGVRLTLIVCDLLKLNKVDWIFWLKINFPEKFEVKGFNFDALMDENFLGFLFYNDTAGYYRICKMNVHGDGYYALIGESGNYWSRTIQLNDPVWLMFGQKSYVEDWRFIPKEKK